MSNQTTVDLRIKNATPGLIADINNYKAVSRALESATADFGVVVSPGTSDEQAVVGGDATGITGITIRSVGKEVPAVGATTLQYEQTEAMALLTEGYIYIRCPSGANQGDGVFFTNADGVLDAGTAAAGQTQIQNARWEDTVAAGEVGRVYIAHLLGLTAGS